MKVALDKVCSLVNSIYGGAALLLLTVLTCAMAVQVFTRYVLGASLSGTEELGRYCFIWMTMLGAGICVSSDSHAAVTILNDHLRGKVKGGHKISVDILILLCAALLLAQGIKMTVMTTRQLTPTLHIPMSVIYASLPVGAIGMILNVVNNLMHRMEEAGAGAGAEPAKACGNDSGEKEG